MSYRMNEIYELMNDLRPRYQVIYETPNGNYVVVVDRSDGNKVKVVHTKYLIVVGEKNGTEV